MRKREGDIAKEEQKIQNDQKPRMKGKNKQTKKQINNL
jgi:hypothetical protein